MKRIGNYVIPSGRQEGVRIAILLKSRLIAFLKETPGV
jgi:hypothetical protein